MYLGNNVDRERERERERDDVQVWVLEIGDMTINGKEIENHCVVGWGISIWTPDTKVVYVEREREIITRGGYWICIRKSRWHTNHVVGRDRVLVKNVSTHRLNIIGGNHN